MGTTTWWGRTPTRLRWAIGFVALGAGQWLIDQLLDWLKPILPSAATRVVGAMQTILSFVEPYWFLLFAVGAAAPFAWERVLGAVRKLRGPRDAAWAVRHLRRVANQKYERTTVRLDGKNFENCHFKEVTFRWDGGDFAFNGTLEGGVRFETRHKTASITVDVLKALHLLGGERGTEFSDSWRRLPDDYFHAIDE